jgi:hypothetical protein
MHDWHKEALKERNGKKSKGSVVDIYGSIIILARFEV